jgi:diaminohydroxyphosphoribosylaminopyrimidine deaminase/5-amino-6-(5-phosphoribosylamino)uracil reductase
MTDDQFMRRALELAERGRGFVEPNPLVGAVIVRDGVIIAEGYHERFGSAHAEVNALNVAKEAARGATVYVTLEPCCHHGKTPPCTEALISAGVARVVAAMADPFPQVSGGGFERLRAANIEVSPGLCELEARRLNTPYLTLINQRRPYVHAKWAMTIDGKIATTTGNSKWISCEESRRRVHVIRGRMDAIIVGAGTVRADDPLLTPRPPGPRSPLRVILTRTGRLPGDLQLSRTAREVPVTIVVPSELVAERLHEFKEAGCELLIASNPAAILAELGRRRFTNVLLEGGAGLIGSFADEGLIDEVHVFIAPKLVGGRGALSPVAGHGIATIAESLQIDDFHAQPSGVDVYLNGRIHRLA